MTNILSINASANAARSTTNAMAASFIKAFNASNETTAITSRDVAAGLPFVDAEWVGANFTDDTDRTDVQKEILGLSDTLINELEASDLILFNLPIYNFGVPASMKAWIDLIARARKTFKYTENGPEGLIKGKKAVVFVSSGGTPVGSPYDFATPFFLNALKFIGITDVEIIGAVPNTTDEAKEKSAALGKALGLRFTSHSQAKAS